MKEDGSPLASSTQAIQTWRDESDSHIFEQSTEDIWKAITEVVKSVLEQSSIDKSQIKGLGWDATCSLAVTDEDGKSVTVSKGSDCGTHGARNIILWADHRAEKEADLINKTGSVVLDYVGGAMSVSKPIDKPLSSCDLSCPVGDGNTEDTLA